MNKAIEVTGSEDDLSRQTVKVHGEELAVADSGEFFGYMGFYSVSKTEVEDTILETEFKKAFFGTGIGFRDVFFPISRVDVYKNVTKSFEHSVSDNNGTRKYKIEPKPAGGKGKASGTKRWLVETYFDTNDSAPTHRNLGYWDMDNGSVLAYNTSGEAAFDEMTSKLKSQIKKYEHIYTDKHIRDSIRRIVRLGQAIPLRPSGGVYFFPWVHRSIVEGLSNLLETISAKYEIGGFGSELYITPVVRNSQQSRKLEEKFNHYNKEKTEELIMEIGQRVKESKESGKPINNRTWAMVRERATHLEEMKETYHNQLDTELQGAELLTDALRQALTDMAGLVGGA